MALASTPAVPATAASTTARRSAAGGMRRSLFCRGWLATTRSTRSRARSWRTLTAATRWPVWTGSNVPPSTPSFSMKSILRSGDLGSTLVPTAMTSDAPTSDLRGWTPSSWRARPAAQQPDWPEEGALDDVLKQLATRPPLVFAGEVRQLTSTLGEVAAGRAFVLQAGDCAESFEAFTAD